MPLLTGPLLFLFKKFALKGGAALTANVLKDIAADPHIAKLLGDLAQNLGMDASEDAVDFLLEGFDTIGELLQALVDI